MGCAWSLRVAAVCLLPGIQPGRVLYSLVSRTYVCGVFSRASLPAFWAGSGYGSVKILSECAVFLCTREARNQTERSAPKHNGRCRNCAELAAAAYIPGLAWDGACLKDETWRFFLFFSAHSLCVRLKIRVFVEIYYSIINKEL